MDSFGIIKTWHLYSIITLEVSMDNKDYSGRWLFFGAIKDNEITRRYAIRLFKSKPPERLKVAEKESDLGFRILFIFIVCAGALRNSFERLMEYVGLF
jgi:hypothetical protein